MVLEQLFFGIYLEKSSHGKVYHNRIIGDAVDEYNSGNGIQLWYSSDIEVSKNHVQGVFKSSSIVMGTFHLGKSAFKFFQFIPQLRGFLIFLRINRIGNACLQRLQFIT